MDEEIERRNSCDFLEIEEEEKRGNSWDFLELDEGEYEMAKDIERRKKWYAQVMEEQEWMKLPSDEFNFRLNNPPPHFSPVDERMSAYIKGVLDGKIIMDRDDIDQKYKNTNVYRPSRGGDSGLSGSQGNLKVGSHWQH